MGKTKFAEQLTSERNDNNPVYGSSYQIENAELELLKLSPSFQEYCAAHFLCDVKMSQLVGK